MNKKGRLMLISSILVVFFLSVLLAFSAGESDDVPVVTLDYPALDQSDVDDYYDSIAGMIHGSASTNSTIALIRLGLNASVVIPSGDSNSSLVNITLFLNITRDINFTRFNDTASYIYMPQNHTLNITGVSNSSSFNPMFLQNGSYVTWAVYACNEQANCSWSGNQTFYVNTDFDTTVPTVSFSLNVSNNSLHNTFPDLDFEIFENTYLRNVTLWVNYSNGVRLNFSQWNGTCNSNGMELNRTANSDGGLSGFRINDKNQTILGNFTLAIPSDGTQDGWYCVKIEAEDYLGNSANSSVLAFEVDSVMPYIHEFVNQSIAKTCNTTEILFNASEKINVSVIYSEATTFIPNNYTVTDTEFTNISKELRLNLTGLNSNKIYYYNINICDEANNCNSSAQKGAATGISAASSESAFYKEWAACTGWNSYGVIAPKITPLGAGLNVSQSLIVSFWNHTHQVFTNYVPGASSNNNTEIYKGQSIWVRTQNDSFVTIGGFMDAEGNTSINDLVVNISNYNSTDEGGNTGNWTSFGLLNAWTLGNLSDLGASGLGANVTFISAYNNSDKRYYDFIYGFIIKNDTEILPGWNVWMWTNKQGGLWWRNATYTSL